MQNIHHPNAQIDFRKLEIQSVYKNGLIFSQTTSCWVHRLFWTSQQAFYNLRSMATRQAWLAAKSNHTFSCKYYFIEVLTKQAINQSLNKTKQKSVESCRHITYKLAVVIHDLQSKLPSKHFWLFCSLLTKPHVAEPCWAYNNLIMDTFNST